MDYKEKLNIFLTNFEHKDDISGVLVCGSFITGTPNNHSDLDVHIVLKRDVDYRERGNVIVDGLLIEYFANSPKQIEKYFKDDIQEFETSSMVQFITGEIIIDKYGDIEELKKLARKLIDCSFLQGKEKLFILNLYGLWDMKDDVNALYENNTKDFEFVYYNKLNSVLSLLFKYLKIPYNTKAVFGHMTKESTRRKYLLKQLEDKNLVKNISIAISEHDRDKRMQSFNFLADYILTEHNFEIDGFKFKSEQNLVL